jgi:hypothetical protein
MTDKDMRGDDIVSFPVPRKYLAVVIHALADAMEEKTSPAAQYGDETTPRGGWTKAKVAILDHELHNATVRTLLGLTADRPGEPIHFGELIAATGKTFPQVRGDLAGFTQLLKRRFADSTWPIQWSEEAGEMRYSMSPDVAIAWKEKGVYKLYDPKEATPSVMVAVAALVFTYVHRERPLLEAIADCAKTLKQNRLSEEQIQAALDYAQVEGEVGWRQKHAQ